MAKRPKTCMDVVYHVPKRKRPVTGSARATSDFLALVHIDNPTLTIQQLKELITDRTRFLFAPEAVAVLDAHIAAGYGNYIPEWRY